MKKLKINDDMVNITCYNSTETRSRLDAIREYAGFVIMCEGCERERYGLILAQLCLGHFNCLNE